MSADLTMWSSEAWSSAADVQLLARSREGSAEAFGELWRRHLPAAYAVARRVRGRTSPEDVVAEAAARVFALIREGRGPTEHFRAYFLSAVRTVALDSSSRDLRLVPTEEDDLDALAEPLERPEPDLGDDEAVDLVREAFRSLPEKDQRVLWHTTVEGAAPRVVAPTLGMSANAVSVRAMRARENLRALYLDARAERGLADADTDECRWTITHLGALVRGRLPKRQTERARAHVATCAHAARLADDLRVIHDGFPALIVPLVLAAGVSTPGFITAGGLGLLGGAAGAAGAGGAAAATSSGGAGAAGAAGAGASGAGRGGAGAGGAAGGGAWGAGRAGTGADAAGQVAGRVASLVAGVAVTAGATGLLGPPVPTTLPADATARPAASASPTPGGAGAATGSGTRVAAGGTTRPGAGSAPAPSGATAPGATSAAAAIPQAASPSIVTGTPAPPPSSGASGPGPVGTPTGSGSSGGSSAGGSPGPRPPTSSTPPAPRPTTRPTPPPVTRPTPPPTTRPTPPPTRTPTPPSPPPSSQPPPEPSSPPTISAKVISRKDPSRFSLSVRTAVPGRLSVTLSNASGAGTLTASNSAWTCSDAGPARVVCTGSGGGGRMQLTQGGLGGLSPVTVVVTDGAGDTYRRTLFG